MPFRIGILAWALGMVISISGARAKDMGAELCPREINTTQNISEKIDGYIVGNKKSRHMLHEIVFYLGDPRSEMSLVYDEVNEDRGGVEEFIYKLSVGDDYWIRCGYFATSVALYKPLPRYSECIVYHDGREVVGIKCR